MDWGENGEMGIHPPKFLRIIFFYLVFFYLFIKKLGDESPNPHLYITNSTEAILEK